MVNVKRKKKVCSYSLVLDQNKVVRESIKQWLGTGLLYENPEFIRIRSEVFKYLKS